MLIAAARRRIDRFPTHKWMARLVVAPSFAAQRLFLQKYISNETFDTGVIVYLWWLSEITAHESWLARELVEDDQQEGDAGGNGKSDVAAVSGLALRDTHPEGGGEGQGRHDPE